MSDLLIIPFSYLSISASLREYILLSIPQIVQGNKISFYRIKQTYRSYFPLQLTKGRQEAGVPGQECREILEHLLNISSREPSLEFKVKFPLPGCLDFILCDHSLSLWLDQLPERVSQFQVTFTAKEQPDFLLHYTHARCCSLLRLGEQEGIIIKYPVSWLELTSTWEKAFFWQLLELSENQVTMSSLIKLAQATLEVERYCRIWGDIKRNQPNLASARLALFDLSRYLLAYLSNDELLQEL